jgi:DnaK suppressor protein
MTRTDLEQFRRSLTDLRTRLRGNIARLTGEALNSNSTLGGATSSAPLHPADAGSDAFEQEFTLSLVENEEQVLGEIDDALLRIERGSYGKCEECQAAIARARLQALPYTRYCVKCARRVQQSS